MLDCGGDRDELMCAVAAFAERKSFVAIGLDDATIRIFVPKYSRRRGLGKYKQIGRFAVQDNASCLAATNDGKYLAMAGESLDRLVAHDAHMFSVRKTKISVVMDLLLLHAVGM